MNAPSIVSKGHHTARDGPLAEFPQKPGRERETIRDEAKQWIEDVMLFFNGEAHLDLAGRADVAAARSGFAIGVKSFDRDVVPKEDAIWQRFGRYISLVKAGERPDNLFNVQLFSTT